MRRPALAQDLVAAKDFQADMPRWMRRMAESGRPLVITEDGRATAVMVDPSALDELEESKEVVRRVVRGLADIGADRVHENESVWSEAEGLISSHEAQSP